ncbi:MAG: hypothetical protein IPK01_11415 [Acidobacteria bacterium]|nr:hypothetical protein [Acidobacteriota bacterium]
MSKTTAVICPKCGNEFNVEDVLAHGIEEKFREKYNEDITNIENNIRAKKTCLMSESRSFENEKWKSPNR